MRGALAAVALAAVLVLAGCGGSGSTPGTEGTTPDDTATPTPGLSDVSYPPGVGEGGVTDAEALLSAHGSELEGRSMRVDISYEVESGTTGQRVDFSGAVDPGTDRALLHVNLSQGSADYYVVGNETYVRQVVGTETSYRTGGGIGALDAPRLGSDRFVAAAIQSANFTPTGVVVRDGRRLVRLEVTGIADPQFTAENVTRTLEGFLLVAENGVVYHASVRTTVETDDGQRYVYGVSVDLSDVGETTVERPAWVDRAEEG